MSASTKALLIVIVLAALAAVVIGLLTKYGGKIMYQVDELLLGDHYEETELEPALAHMGWTTLPPYLHFTLKRTGTEANYEAEIIQYPTEGPCLPNEFRLIIDGAITCQPDGEACKVEIRRRDAEL